MTSWEKEQREWLVEESKKAIVKLENKKALVWAKYPQWNKAQARRVRAMIRHYDRQIAKEREFLAIA
ncbi:MAG: hypothetical protein IJ586_00090 [Alloprevotella sp.]|nr:hypothetical protein [Alloprevotella sp.]